MTNVTGPIESRPSSVDPNGDTTPLASIIIPVWRDADTIESTLRHLPPEVPIEIIVAHVLGEDGEYAGLRHKRPDLRWVAAPRGRAVQMNAGAAVARGRWLVFLHADSRLPPNWRSVLEQAAERSGVVGGSFRLVLDSPAWQARVLEWGVRLRVAILSLPYGDQALFADRRTFGALGGYPDWPLMEDIAFIRRLGSAGRLFHSRAPVVTSARRWARDGWFRRSAGNLWLATRFLLGASPARLAQRYFRRSAQALVVMARAPWTGGKTRLQVGEGPAHDALRDALFRDTLDVALAVPGTQHIVACEPPEAIVRLRGSVPTEVDIIAQRGTGLGERLIFAFEDTFRLGAQSVVIIGSDLPDLPADRIARAFEALGAEADRVVIGPAADGGYYLIGMNRVRRELFADIDWDGPRVREQTLATAAGAGVPVVLLAEWQDVDSPVDLDRLRGGGGDAAPRTRRWLADAAPPGRMRP